MAPELLQESLITARDNPNLSRTGSLQSAAFAAIIPITLLLAVNIDRRAVQETRESPGHGSATYHANMCQHHNKRNVS